MRDDPLKADPATRRTYIAEVMKKIEEEAEATRQSRRTPPAPDGSTAAIQGTTGFADGARAVG